MLRPRLSRCRSAASALLLTASSWACSFIEFEHGPYAIRTLWVVYSEQEDLTFLSWRLGEEADARRVRFELDVGAGFSSIELERAPFPAGGFACPGGLCFQYQLPGRVTFPEGARPIRAVHDIDGPLIGPEPKLFSASETFRASPFPIYANSALEIGIESWFEHHAVPLSREHEWQLVGALAPRDVDACEPPGPSWSEAEPVIDLEPSWLDAHHCLALRPRRHDRASPHLLLPIEAAAETRLETRRYEPMIEESPIMAGIVFDLEVPDEERCSAIQRAFEDLIHHHLSERGELIDLGTFGPLERDSPTRLNGCEQVPGRRLPLADMLEALLDLDPAPAPPFKPLWIYVNNLSLPLSPSVGEGLAELGLGTAAISETEPLMIALASSPVLGSFHWSHRITWRRVQDPTLEGDVQAFAEQWLPLRSLLHDSSTQVPIRPLPGRPPEMFKLCKPSPGLDTMGSEEDGVLPWPAVLPWPSSGTPFFTVDLGEQVLVPYQEIVAHEVVYVLDACYAYCDRAFRVGDGTVLPSWRDDTRCRRGEDGER